MISLIKKALKNSAIYGLGNISTKLLGFALLPIYMDKFDIHQYGALGLLEATAQVLIVIFGFSLYVGLNRWYFQPEYEKKKKQLFSSVLFTLLTFIIVMIALIFTEAQLLSTLVFKSDQFSYLLKLVAICAGFEILSEIFMTLLKLQERPILFSVGSIVKILFNLLFTIYFVIYQNHGIEGVYHAQLIGHSVYFLFMIPILRTEFTFSFNIQVIKELFLFSLPMMLSSVSLLLLTQVDRYMLGSMQQLSSVGEYTLGYKFANCVKVFIVFSVQMAISPMIYRVMDHPNNKRFYSKIMTYFTFGVIPFSLIVSMFGKDLIKALSSNSDYLNAFQVIPIISLAIIFGMLKDTAVIGLNLKKKTKVIASITVFISIFNVVLNYILIPIYDINGAATATLISQVIYFYGIYYFAQNAYHIPYELKKIALMIFIATCLFTLSNVSFGLNFWGKFTYKIGLVILFPILLFGLRFFEAIEIQAMRNFAVKLLRKNELKK